MVSIATLLAVLFVHATRSAGPCELLAKATVADILGQPAVSGRAQGPEKDEDTGGMMSLCMFQGGQSAMFVSELTFASAAAAKKATTQELVKSRMDDDGAVVKAESGVGDAAYWATTKEGAEFVVLKGAKVIAVGFGGKLPKPPASYHDVLRAAAIEASGAR